MSRLSFCLATLLLVACGSDEPTIPLDVPAPEDFEVSGCFGCDDGDFCTDDLCREDGSCLHVARNAFNACQVESHCDDGDSCTVDVCMLDECNLLRCASAAKFLGCQSCDFGECDDGDPCTVDSCGEDKICTFSEPDPACNPLCSVRNSVGPFEVSWRYGTSFWGEISTVAGATCEGDACTCTTALRLGTSGVSFELANRSGGDAWRCEIDACESHTADCAPMYAGVGYVVYGEPVYLNTFDQAPPFQPEAQFEEAGASADTAGASDAGAPPQLIVESLLADGFCLSTLLTHLPGDYAGRFESGGQIATFPVNINSDAFPEEQILEARFGTCDNCAATGLAPGQHPQIGAVADVVSFSLTVAGNAGKAALFPDETAFRGDVTTSAGTFLGRLTLERLPLD